MRKRTEIGFTQRIKLQWLEQTVELLLAGKSRLEILAVLDDLLRSQVSVGTPAVDGKNNRKNVISVLSGVWVWVPGDTVGLRDDALRYMSSLASSEHLPFHWGMSVASYPFFGVVAETVGKLLRLQDTAAVPQIQSRIQEVYGERENVSRATRRVLRTMHDWGVLQETGQPGVYKAGNPRQITDEDIGVWLAEAIILSKGGRPMSLSSILRSSALFPFTLPPLSATDVMKSPRLDAFRHGFDEEMVLLRTGGTKSHFVPVTMAELT